METIEKVNDVIETVAEKADDVKEVATIINDSASLQADVSGGDKTQYIISGVLTVLGVLGILKIIDLIKTRFKKFKNWRLRKDIEKHPEKYLTTDEVDIVDEKGDDEEEKPEEVKEETKPNEVKEDNPNSKKKK